MANVSFEWADGPNANAEAHVLRAYDAQGQQFKPEIREVKYHKNGQWSYNDCIVSLPSGSYVYLVDRDTARNTEFTIFRATESGKEQLYYGRKAWSQMLSKPEAPDSIPADVWDAMLRQIVTKQETWNTWNSVRI